MNFEYHYNLKDHLGNVRVSFTTGPQPANEYLATMEEGEEGLMGDMEEQWFTNLEETRHPDDNYDHSDAGSVYVYSAALNAAAAKIVGPSIMLEIIAGDAVDIEVYAKYGLFSGSNSGIDAAALMAALATSFATSSVTGEMATNLLNPFDGLSTSLISTIPNTDGSPAAYLNWIFFDRDMEFVSSHSGYEKVSRSAEGNFELLSKNDFVFDRRGYLYIYVSNETVADVYVHFDDLKITHKKGAIVQMDDYYPFGLTFNSYQRTTTKKNDYLYNSFEYMDDLSLNLYDYQARYYDPALGRFINIDPMADIARRNGVYNYAYNNPLRYIDPDGMVASDTIKTQTDTNDSNTDSNTKKRQRIDDWPDPSEDDDGETTEESLWAKVVAFLSPKAGDVLVSGTDGAGPMEAENDRPITLGETDIDLLTIGAKSPKPSSKDPSVDIANSVGSIFSAISEYISGDSEKSNEASTSSKEKVYHGKYQSTIRNAGDVKDSTVTVNKWGEMIITSPDGTITRKKAPKIN